MGKYAPLIVKELEKIYTGTSRYEVFDDFLDVVLATLEALPRNATTILNGETPSIDNDTPETQELFKKIDSKYGQKGYDQMAKAFTLLIQSTEEWEDALGDAYMSWNISNSRTGQYFTPISIARMMAEINNPSELLNQRLYEAYTKSRAGLMHSIFCENDTERIQKFVLDNPEACAAQCYEDIKPITVLDPACGSGVMFIAMASVCPKWAMRYGLVQCYGMDIDQTCVQMAKINLMIYGLGAKIKAVNSLTQQELDSIPEPHQSLYKQVIDNPETKEEVKAKLQDLKQVNLF